MNKKFFAALASATMAFTATGSIAVFADDFVEENNVVKPGDLEQNPTKVKFSKENFGALVEAGAVVFKKADGSTLALTKDNEYETTKEYAEVAAIELQTQFNGEIKGLEHFPNLKSLFAATGTVTNKTLDFSENTKLKDLTVTNAADLAGITLPNPETKKVDGVEKEVYNLTTLYLQGTKLTKLDLSKQEGLFNSIDFSNVTVKDNKNLKEVTLKTATSTNQAKLSKLDLQNNALETVNLENYAINDAFNLDDNHIGVLNLTKTNVPSNGTLGTQTFYVYEKAANVNLKETFADLDVDYVDGKDFNVETGVFPLTAKDTTYKYETNVKGATDSKLTVKISKANPMNRLYNPNSGEHFYTADVKEKEALVKLGWNDEGYGWVARNTDGASETLAVYRLYNPNAGDHHYTMSEDERDTLVTFGWKYENVGWYSVDGNDTVSVYRQYNPYANGAGSHNYTTDKAENDFLLSAGWIYEGKAWNAHR